MPYEDGAPYFTALSKYDTLIHDQGQIWRDYSMMFKELGGYSKQIDRQIKQLKDDKARGEQR